MLVDTEIWGILFQVLYIFFNIFYISQFLNMDLVFGSD